MTISSPLPDLNAAPSSLSQNTRGGCSFLAPALSKCPSTNPQIRHAPTVVQSRWICFHSPGKVRSPATMASSSVDRSLLGGKARPFPLLPFPSSFSIRNFPSLASHSHFLSSIRQFTPLPQASVELLDRLKQLSLHSHCHHCLPFFPTDQPFSVRMHSAIFITAALILASAPIYRCVPGNLGQKTLHATHAVLESFPLLARMAETSECGATLGVSCKANDPFGNVCCSRWVRLLNPWTSYVSLTFTGLLRILKYPLRKRLSGAVRVRRLRFHVDLADGLKYMLKEERPARRALWGQVRWP
jgi:hypothetical protein